MHVSCIFVAVIFVGLGSADPRIDDVPGITTTSEQLLQQQSKIIDALKARLDAQESKLLSATATIGLLTSRLDGIDSLIHQGIAECQNCSRRLLDIDLRLDGHDVKLTDHDAKFKDHEVQLGAHEVVLTDHTFRLHDHGDRVTRVSADVQDVRNSVETVRRRLNGSESLLLMNAQSVGDLQTEFHRTSQDLRVRLDAQDLKMNSSEASRQTEIQNVVKRLDSQDSSLKSQHQDNMILATLVMNLNASLDDLGALLNSTVTSVQKIEADNQALKTFFNAQNSQMNSLNYKLFHTTTIALDNQAKLNSSSVLLQQNRLDLLDNNLQTQESMLHQESSQRQALALQLGGMLTTLNQSYVSIQESCNAQSQQLQTQQNELQRESAKGSALELKLEDVASNMTSSQSEIQHALADHRSFKIRLDHCDQELTSDGQQLRQATDSLRDLSTRIDAQGTALNSTLSMLQHISVSQTQSLDNRIKELDTRARSLDHRLHNQETQTSGLSTRVHNAELSIQQTLTVDKNQNDQLADHNQRLIHLDARITRGDTNTNNVKTQVASHHQAINSLQTSLQTLQHNQASSTTNHQQQPPHQPPATTAHLGGVSLTFKGDDDDDTTLHHGDVLKFNQVTSQTLSGYSTSSGVFTAPTSGLYFLDLHFTQTEDEKTILAIQVDGSSKAEGGVLAESGSGSASCLARVNRGGKISVKLVSHSSVKIVTSLLTSLDILLLQPL